MANIIFRIPQRLYILNDFTKEVLNKIENKMTEIRKDRKTNECNFYDFEEFVTFENLKTEVTKNIKEAHYGIEYIAIQINSDIHKTANKYVINRILLETFKSLYLSTIFISKRYEIESNKNNILKLKGLEKEVDLNEVKYDYKIQE